eukprot:SAG31_NODE_12905_length_907_cov_1.273515_1_plen_127_part_01
MAGTFGDGLLSAAEYAELVRDGVLAQTTRYNVSIRDTFRAFERGQNCLGTVDFMGIKYGLEKLKVIGPGHLDDSDHAMKRLLRHIGRYATPEERDKGRSSSEYIVDYPLFRAWLRGSSRPDLSGENE